MNVMSNDCEVFVIFSVFFSVFSAVRWLRANVSWGGYAPPDPAWEYPSSSINLRLWQWKLVLEWEKTNQKKESKLDLGGSGGSICKSFGTVWVFFWALWDVSWPFSGCSNSSLFKPSAQDGLQEGFGITLGSILEGFQEELGRSWEDFEAFWDDLWRDLGEILVRV